ncbi:MAG: hypothetical protein ACO3A2_05930 [Bdellovibrionia bacterium]
MNPFSNPHFCLKKFMILSLMILLGSEEPSLATLPRSTPLSDSKTQKYFLPPPLPPPPLNSLKRPPRGDQTRPRNHSRWGRLLIPETWILSIAYASLSTEEIWDRYKESISAWAKASATDSQASRFIQVISDPRSDHTLVLNSYVQLLKELAPHHPLIPSVEAYRDQLNQPTALKAYAGLTQEFTKTLNSDPLKPSRDSLSAVAQQCASHRPDPELIAQHYSTFLTTYSEHLKQPEKPSAHPIEKPENPIETAIKSVEQINHSTPRALLSSSCPVLSEEQAALRIQRAFRAFQRNKKKTPSNQEPEHDPEIKAITAKLKDQNQSFILNELMKLNLTQLDPKDKIIIGNRTFYTTGILEGSQRPHVILYTEIEHEGQKLFVPRLFYKSRSDGGWRSCPQITEHGYSKGNKIHYTQETKPHQDIIHALQKLETRPKERLTEDQENEVYSHFYWPDPNSKNELHPFRRNSNHFKEESKNQAESQLLKIFQECTPGDCFECDLAQDYAKATSNPLGRSLLTQATDLMCARIFSNSTFKSIEDQPKKNFTHYIETLNQRFNDEAIQGFIPNFNQAPDRTYRFDHSLLGETTVQVFHSSLNGKPLEWHMAKDQEGRVWIERIRNPQNRINSYGTDEQVLDSGILTNKPLEYTSQARALLLGSEKREFSKDPDYVDITPILSQLLPIRQFIEAEQKRSLKSPRSSESGNPVSKHKPSSDDFNIQAN